MSLETIVEELEIETDAPVYFPGSVIEGRIRLRTRKDVMCSGIFLEALGAAHCIVDAEPHPKVLQHVYYQRKMTMFGGIYRTEDGIFDEKSIQFSTRMTPDGGTLHVPVSKRDKRFLLELIGVSGGEDKVLGAARFSPHAVIDNCRSKDGMDLPLTLDGAIVTATVRCKATWQQTPSGHCQELRLGKGNEVSRVVVVDIASAMLKEMSEMEADLEHIYCRLTAVSEAVGEEGVQIRIPPVDVVLPFSVKLPEELPTAIDTDKGVCIRYSIACTLGGSEEKLPSAVCHFGIIQSRCRCPSSLPIVRSTKKAGNRRWIPCGCNTTIPMTTQIDRSIYAAGMPVNIRLDGENTLNVPISIRIDLVREHRLHTSAQNDSSFFAEFALIPSIGTDKKKPFRFDWSIPFPSVAPTYEGIGNREMEPLTWDYRIVVTVEARQEVTLTHSAPIYVTASVADALSATTSEHLRRPRIKKNTQLAPEIVYGEWRDVSRKEAVVEAPFAVSHALNKSVQNGKCQERPFIPVYTTDT